MTAITVDKYLRIGSLLLELAAKLDSQSAIVNPPLTLNTWPVM